MNGFKREIRCVKDDDFNHIRNVEYSCGCRFDIDENSIYSVNSLNYFSEDIKEYYVICPYCGHINKVDETILPDDVKMMADLKSILEPLLYRKNNLRSELIYLDRVSKPYILERTR